MQALYTTQKIELTSNYGAGRQGQLDVLFGEEAFQVA